MPLCQSCQRFNIHSFSADPDSIRTYRLAAVEDGAQKDCDFCCLLRTTLKDDIAWLPYPASFCWIQLTLANDADLSEKQNSGPQYNKLSVRLANRPFLRPLLRSHDDELGEHELCVAADGESPAAKNQDVAGRYLGEDPASDLHIFAIQQWLDECSVHPECTQTNSGQFQLHARNALLPTRCIDVKDHRVVLRETGRRRGTYITLSHRWNETTEHCKTTVENVEARRKGLDLASLSKSFQDAILVTQRLGIQYLWIDSICIVQSGDNGEDWEREALKMGQYYQHSILTLAVTTTAFKNGFLSPRPQSAFTSLARLPYRDKDGIQNDYFYIYKRRNHVNEQFMSEVWNSELLRRGWVFQEWLLSRRIVYFTPSQMFFECQAKRPQSECQEATHLRHRPSTLKKGFDLKTNFDFTMPSIEKTWYQIVEVYSRLSFTMPDKDRVIALSGIANEVREVFSEKDLTSGEHKPLEYISGLWLRDIHYGLLWQQKSAPPMQYVRVHGLPSWSWSSLLLEVEWLERRHETQNALTVVGLISANGTIRPTESSVEHSPSTSPLLHAPSEDIRPNPDQYDVHTIFAALRIRARLLPVCVRGSFLTKEDLRLAAWATGVQINDRDVKAWLATNQADGIDPAALEATLSLDPVSKPWKAICSLRSPDLVGGWGSFEQYEFGNLSQTSSGTVIEAVHVSTEKELPGGFAFGYYSSMSHDVYNVLFVEKAPDGEQYRRIGVGRIFDKGMIQDFTRAEPQYIEIA
ncbi:MAG: hypothetical protein Q9160_002332 [Pyrenula sp. 1 TL-2023]